MKELYCCYECLTTFEESKAGSSMVHGNVDVAYFCSQTCLDTWVTFRKDHRAKQEEVAKAEERLKDRFIEMSMGAAKSQEVS